jgi:hypothetical protein
MEDRATAMGRIEPVRRSSSNGSTWHLNRMPLISTPILGQLARGAASAPARLSNRVRCGISLRRIARGWVARATAIGTRAAEPGPRRGGRSSRRELYCRPLGIPAAVPIATGGASCLSLLFVADGLAGLGALEGIGGLPETAWLALRLVALAGCAPVAAGPSWAPNAPYEQEEPRDTSGMH